MNAASKAILFSVLAAALLVGLLFWKPGETGRAKIRQPLIVYCAAGIKPPMEAAARAYEQAYEVNIQLQYGGSGTLLSNLRVSRQGDLFLAADDSYLQIARTNLLVDEVIPLARIRPVIAVRKGNPKKIAGLSDLLREEVVVAQANPDAAAVGKVTRDLLLKSGEWPALEKHTRVFKTTVNDVANDIKLGTVDAGIIWDATAGQYPELDQVKVPAFELGEQSISIGVLKFSRHPTEALKFARYLGARDRGLKHFSHLGYRPVEGDLWRERPEVVLYSGGVNRTAIEETIKRFETREGAHITRVYNGCGLLVSQMKAGQRPDAYFACDLPFLRQVNDQFLDPVEISETPLVILVVRGNPKGIKVLADLAKPGLRLGWGNPQQTALGALTTRILQEANLYDSIKPNVRSETPTGDLLVNQMKTGSLDAVLVYEAHAAQVREALEVIPLPLPGARAIQPFAIGRSSDHKFLVERLREAILSAESRKQFESVGFRWRAGAVAP